MNIEVKILRNEHQKPADKLADAEIHFIGGELDGLKLVGFAIWHRRDGPGRSVTFPARQFIVHGDKRNFALLRGDQRSERRRTRFASSCSARTTSSRGCPSGLRHRRIHSNVCAISCCRRTQKCEDIVATVSR